MRARQFPGRLHHNKTPGWVPAGSLFHVRIRAGARCTLTSADRAPQLLRMAAIEHERGRWWCELFLIMPDHLHALLAFPHGTEMSESIRTWKRLLARRAAISWQDGYFDHRLRNKREASETWNYIRENPVVLGLCAHPDDWPWWYSGSSDTVHAHAAP